MKDAGAGQGAWGENPAFVCRAFAVVVVILLPRAALACPNCDAGRRAWSEVWSQGAAWNVFAAVAPFVVIAVIAFLCQRIGDGIERRSVEP